MLALMPVSQAAPAPALDLGSTLLDRHQLQLALGPMRDKHPLLLPLVCLPRLSCTRHGHEDHLAWTIAVHHIRLRCLHDLRRAGNGSAIRLGAGTT